MKTRQEIKALAKEAVARQRGTAILLGLVSSLAIFIISAVSGFHHVLMLGVPGLLVYTIVSLGGTAITYVIMVNLLGEFIKVFKHETASVGALFTEIPVNFLRKLGGMLWMGLWIFLWSMLLVIPGIIKSFSYYFTGNILADCPNVTARQALKISMRITRGHKMDIFIFVLSWLGWMLLSGLTLGILWIVYVGPYYYAADAGLYLELKEKALREGTITYEELGMAAPAGSFSN